MPCQRHRFLAASFRHKSFPLDLSSSPTEESTAMLTLWKPKRQFNNVTLKYGIAKKKSSPFSLATTSDSTLCSLSGNFLIKIGLLQQIYTTDEIIQIRPAFFHHKSRQSVSFDPYILKANIQLMVSTPQQLSVSPSLPHTVCRNCLRRSDFLLPQSKCCRSLHPHLTYYLRTGCVGSEIVQFA